MTLAAGTRIGVYEISGALGAGGMGEIYRARDVRLDRTVAIKALPREFAHDPERRARFEREARLVASLSHANIAGIYGIEDFERVPFLVLEFVPGETLAARLSRGPISPSEAAAIGRQIASAIGAAHERGIVHRDLKPGNVMLTPEGVVKVLDFGIAKADHAYGATQTAEAMTREGAVLGTAAYMSPEQARGHSVDRRTDIWAFGCILFECLAGRKPFQGASGTDTIAKVLEREPDWGALPSSMPAALRDGIRRCLQKDPSQRPLDLGDLRRELERLSAAPGTIASASMPSLAVLYFENLSSDKESEYFCAGITEDILTDLSKIKGLRVASRNAVAKFRGTAVDIPRVAADLGVTAVMEGSVRRSGERVRITAQLINASDGFHLWAERYDRTLDDVFAVQEEIASSIAVALRGALTPNEARELQRDRPSNAKAYDLYLKGREQYGRYERESLTAAMELFRQAIEVDPDYALAWAGVADCYGQLHQWGWDPNREGLPQGLQAARRAISLDPKLAEGYKAEALVLRELGDREKCTEALLLAVQRNPRYTPALNNLAVSCFENGSVAGAERYIRQILRIDPHDPFATMWLSQITLLTGRIRETLEVTQQLLRISTVPFYIGGSRITTAVAHLQEGDEEGATRTLSEMPTEIPLAKSAVLIVRAVLAKRKGDLEMAGQLVDQAATWPQLGTLQLLMAAEVEVARGRLEQARDFVTRPNVVQNMIRLVPGLWPLLDHPPFSPRRSAFTLVWPKEAPPPPDGVEQLFQEVRFESGSEPPGRG